MLKWDKNETINGLTVYADADDWTMSYVLPQTARFRIDDTGSPVFKFMKYRFPIDRPGGKKGGGFLVCDVEFGVSAAEENAVRELLQERINEKWQASGNTTPAPQATIGRISYTRGAASVTILDSGGVMVEKITNPASPSLYGRMVLPITVELSPEGATLLESALQEKGGVVQVTYDIWTPVKLPPLTANVWFNASKFSSFHQEIDVEENFCSEDDYREKIVELVSQSESGGVTITPGTVTDQKVIGAVRDWAWNSLADATTRMVLGDIPIQNQEDARKLYTEQDFENITKDVMSTRLVSFSRRYTENMVMEWNPQPRGTIPNITTMLDKDGNPFRWEDFASTVDLNDPFFKTLTVNARANADFDHLPLHSIEVKIEYDPTGENIVEEQVLTSATDIFKFQQFLSNNNRQYTYTYQVNYEGESQAFVSEPKKTNDTSLVLNVGDTGILNLEIAPGDINFDQVTSAQISLWYQDGDVPRRETSFVMDKTHQEHTWTEVIFAPRRQAVHYTVKYLMADGREITGDEQTTGSNELRINDPFTSLRTINIRGFGDFTNRIDVIFVDLTYTGATPADSQTHSVVLKSGATEDIWEFPAIDQTGGTVTYTGVIRFKAGPPKAIPLTTLVGTAVEVGDVTAEQVITVMSDLVDWSEVRLVKVTLKYDHGDVKVSKDLVFKNGGPSTLVWNHELDEDPDRSYAWQAQYFKVDNTTAVAAVASTLEDTVVLPSLAG